MLGEENSADGPNPPAKGKRIKMPAFVGAGSDPGASVPVAVSGNANVKLACCTQVPGY